MNLRSTLNFNLQRRLRISFLIALLFSLMGFAPALRSQSLPTASRVGDLQLGGGFVFGHSDYNFTPTSLLGGAGYFTFDPRPHWGMEFAFRQVRSSVDTTVTERTYEIGPRVLIHRGKLSPYAKALYGRGVYNFHNSVANIAYNMLTFGGGADYGITRSINIRADYEYQTWAGFPLGSFHPSIVTIGVAYHFHQ